MVTLVNIRHVSSTIAGSSIQSSNRFKCSGNMKEKEILESAYMVKISDINDVTFTLNVSDLGLKESEDC